MAVHQVRLAKQLLAVKAAPHEMGRPIQVEEQTAQVVMPKAEQHLASREPEQHQLLSTQPLFTAAIPAEQQALLAVDTLLVEEPVAELMVKMHRQIHKLAQVAQVYKSTLMAITITGPVVAEEPHTQMDLAGMVVLVAVVLAPEAAALEPEEQAADQQSILVPMHSMRIELLAEMAALTVVAVAVAVVTMRSKYRIQAEQADRALSL